MYTAKTVTLSGFVNFNKPKSNQPLLSSSLHPPILATPALPQLPVLKVSQMKLEKKT
ncbi:hypothetical protein PtB15_12B183 [Puccinia triticina]|nr:hypothetical protein PtB15_12B183 [Puccinia triticina]